MAIGAALAWDDGGCEVTIIPGEGTYLVGSLCGGRRKVWVGAPDPTLTSVSGMAAVTELVERLGVVASLDAAVGPIKQRDRGFGAGEVLVGLAAAQVAGEDFLAGLDRQRGDVAGQVIAPVSGLSSTTAAGLARRFTDPQWIAVETGVARVTERGAGCGAGGAADTVVQHGDDRSRRQ